MANIYAVLDDNFTPPKKKHPQSTIRQKKPRWTGIYISNYEKPKSDDKRTLVVKSGSFHNTVSIAAAGLCDLFRPFLQVTEGTTTVELDEKYENVIGDVFTLLKSGSVQFYVSNLLIFAEFSDYIGIPQIIQEEIREKISCHITELDFTPEQMYKLDIDPYKWMNCALEKYPTKEMARFALNLNGMTNSFWVVSAMRILTPKERAMYTGGVMVYFPKEIGKASEQEIFFLTDYDIYKAHRVKKQDEKFLVKIKEKIPFPYMGISSQGTFIYFDSYCVETQDNTFIISKPPYYMDPIYMVEICIPLYNYKWS